GLHGAGKTTAAKHLAKKFGLEYVCAGDVFRQMAKERGLTLEEFSKVAERDPRIDLMIDKRTARMARRGNVLIDGRLAGWMAKKADLRILLTAPLEVRVKRIVGRERRRYKEVLRETRARERSEAKRFRKFYHIDVNDYSKFDLVVNTANLSAEEVAKILEAAVASIMRR
ncbi:MAG: AAA family ATPase, partial [Candidatus Hadarchaeales archaeon]